MTRQTLSSINAHGFYSFGNPVTCFGFSSWSCFDIELPKRSRTLLTKVNNVAKLAGLNPDHVFVVFNNYCIVNHKTTYDSFKICNIVTGQEILTVVPSSAYSGLCEVYIDSPGVLDKGFLKACNVTMRDREAVSYFKSYTQFLRLVKSSI